MRFRFLIPLLIAAAALAACGETKTGSNGLFNYTPSAPGNFAFQTPTAAGQTPSAAAAIGTQGAAPTATAAARPTQQQQAPPFEIDIYGDSGNQIGFQPPNAQIYQGTVINFVNKDAQARSVVSDSGDPASFSSPSLAPGATWSYTASTLGTFSYHDGTRPYTVGQFKVISR